MKKLTIVGMMIFAIGATAFARGHQNWDNNGGRHHRTYDCVQGEGRMARRSPEMERTRLVIDEKRLEIRKELVKENPDWKKVERLNTEIATEQGRARTTMMKDHHEYQRRLPATPVSQAN